MAIPTLIAKRRPRLAAQIPSHLLCTPKLVMENSFIQEEQKMEIIRRLAYHLDSAKEKNSQVDPKDVVRAYGSTL